MKNCTTSQCHSACQFQSHHPELELQFKKEGQILRPHEIPIPNKNLGLSQVTEKSNFDKILGSMIGMALGDALGAHVEFRPHEYMLQNQVSEMQGGGTWGLDKGQFTDDTSMALCLGCSLVARHDLCLYDQLVRYKWWYRHGYMSSTGHCFDIGAATRDSIEEFEKRQKRVAKEKRIPIDELDYLSEKQLLDTFPVYCSRENVAGNGALMRLAPVPLFFYRDPRTAVHYSGLSGLITHGDLKARDACRYYGALIVAAVHGLSKDKLLSPNFYTDHQEWFADAGSLHPDILAIAKGSFQRTDGYNGGIRGKGYVVNALEAALWAFWSDKNSFTEGARLAVNLGDDTDTTAAIYGQLAGAHYGLSQVNPGWIEQLYARNFIEYLTRLIVLEGDTWFHHKSGSLNKIQSCEDGEAEDQQENQADVSSAAAQATYPKEMAKSSTASAESSKSTAISQAIGTKSDQLLGAHQKTPKKTLRTNDEASRNQNDQADSKKSVPNTPARTKSASGPSKSAQKASPVRSAPLEEHPIQVASASTGTRTTPIKPEIIIQQLKTAIDVCEWIQKIDPSFETYKIIIKNHRITGKVLLHEINREKLEQYGIKNEKDLNKIWSAIVQLRRELGINASTK